MAISVSQQKEWLTANGACRLLGERVDARLADRECLLRRNTEREVSLVRVRLAVQAIVAEDQEGPKRRMSTCIFSLRRSGDPYQFPLFMLLSWILHVAICGLSSGVVGMRPQLYCCEVSRFTRRTSASLFWQLHPVSLTEMILLYCGILTLQTW